MISIISYFHTYRHSYIYDNNQCRPIIRFYNLNLGTAPPGFLGGCLKDPNGVWPDSRIPERKRVYVVCHPLRKLWLISTVHANLTRSGLCPIVPWQHVTEAVAKIKVCFIMMWMVVFCNRISMCEGNAFFQVLVVLYAVSFGCVVFIQLSNK